MSYRGPSIPLITRHACLSSRKEAIHPSILLGNLSSFSSLSSFFLFIQLKAPLISSSSAATTFFSLQASSTIDISTASASRVLLAFLHPNYLLCRMLLSLHQVESYVAIVFSTTFLRQFRRLITLYTFSIAQFGLFGFLSSIPFTIFQHLSQCPNLIYIRLGLKFSLYSSSKVV